MIHYLPTTLAHTTLIPYCQTSSPQIITYEYFPTTLQNLYFVDVQLSLNVGNGCNHLSLGKEEIQELYLYRFYIISCELTTLFPQMQANCAVCMADDSGATALSFSASCKDLYGTQCIGLYGKIRSWKSVSLL